MLRPEPFDRHYSIFPSMFDRHQSVCIGHGKATRSAERDNQAQPQEDA